MDKQSCGLSAEYYELPKGATELQHLIMAKNMNAQLGEIFRACYRYGEVSHSPPKRDIKKIITYALFEYERLLLGGSTVDVCNAELTRHRENIIDALMAMEQLATATTTAPTRPSSESTFEDLQSMLKSVRDESAAQGRTPAIPRAKPSFSDVFYSARMCDRGVK